jgi:hypothetical protein
MHRHLRLLLTSLAATAILAAAVSSASAQNLSISHQQIRVVWRSLELTNNVTSGTVKCPVTLEGSFHSSTIRKIRKALIGYITRAAVGTAANCTGGRATINQETLPWHLTYLGFIGRLPNIEFLILLLVRASFIIAPNEGNVCRATTTVENPAAGIATVGGGGAITALRADETFGIPLVNGPGGVFCGLGTGRFSGVGTVSQLGNSNAISVRLI